ncbi:hypothetical protein KAR91_39215, partial [Candidatus Pacearchaeota archaeon]|nr:hypothetical protein [Candidatus Pacearchaeota archaeon]
RLCVNLTTNFTCITLTYMTVSNDELVEAILRPIDRAYKKAGITPTRLAKCLDAELKATETKIIKIKGAVQQQDLPKGFTVIATTGLIEYDKQGAEIYCDGETVIRYDPAALGIRQKARESADNVMGHIPARKHELAGENGKPIEIIVKSWKDDDWTPPTT